MTTPARTDARDARSVPPLDLKSWVSEFGAPALVAQIDGPVVERNHAGATLFGDLKHLDDLTLRTVPGDNRITWKEIGQQIRANPAAASCTVTGTANRQSDPTEVQLAIVSLRTEPKQTTGLALLLVTDHPSDLFSFEENEMSRRLASLGKLAAQVAHELNNPLDGILRYVNLAIRIAEQGRTDKLNQYLSESRTGLMRMVEIITELLEFTRNPDENLQSTSINEIIEDAIRCHAPAAESNLVVLASDFQSQDMPQMRGNRFFQVCSNLLRNAIDAMPNGGRVTITTGRVGKDVIVEVSDSGPGLPDDPSEVFKPFYTTKSPGKGTGIGLAICKDFIEDLGGTITAMPAPDGGALFRIVLPQDEDCEGRASSPGESQAD
ncbi:MAG: sensor histidine kinase [Planctomycetota bacterium]|jgi:signal transduction histidine kinase